MIRVTAMHLKAEASSNVFASTFGGSNLAFGPEANGFGRGVVAEYRPAWGGIVMSKAGDDPKTKKPWDAVFVPVEHIIKFSFVEDVAAPTTEEIVERVMAPVRELMDGPPAATAPVAAPFVPLAAEKVGTPAEPPKRGPGGPKSAA